MACNFETGIGYRCLVDHCKSAHDWKDLPCLIDGCQFVAYSKFNFLHHKTVLHSSRNRSYAPKEYKCTWKNCHSSFKKATDLSLHFKIHTNNLIECSFCPYRNINPHKMIVHYRNHYKVYEYKCDSCEKRFVDEGSLLKHTRISHLIEMTSCPVCDRTGSMNAIQGHLRGTHKLLSKWNKDKKQFEVYKP